jgi:hypothetical protein
MVIAQALNLSLTLSQALLLLAAMGLASAVSSTLGYVSIYQFVVVTVLAPFGFSERRIGLYPRFAGSCLSGGDRLGRFGLVAIGRERNHRVTRAPP